MYGPGPQNLCPEPGGGKRAALYPLPGYGYVYGEITIKRWDCPHELGRDRDRRRQQSPDVCSTTRALISFGDEEMPLARWPTFDRATGRQQAAQRLHSTSLATLCVRRRTPQFAPGC